MTDRLIRIKQYEQAADDKVSIGGIKWLQKWDVCIQCDSAKEAEALRARLAQPEPEPVAWTPVTTRLPQYDDDRRVLCYCAEYDYGGTQFITLKASEFWEYDPDGDGEPGTADSRTVTHWILEDDAIAWATSAAAPPQREWQGLTDEEIEDVCWTEVDQRLCSFARGIERLIRSKNE